jgi:hypothetical protein
MRSSLSDGYLKCRRDSALCGPGRPGPSSVRRIHFRASTPGVATRDTGLIIIITKRLASRIKQAREIAGTQGIETIVVAGDCVGINRLDQRNNAEYEDKEDQEPDYDSTVD